MTSDAPQSPLRRQLSEQAERAKREYLSHGFSRGDYEELAERAGRTIEQLEASGVEAAALEFVREQKRVLDAVLKLLADPTAGTVAPSNQEIYAAGLIVARLSRIAEGLKAASKTWHEQTFQLLRELSCDDEASGERLILLEFAGLCRAARLACRPREPLACEIELDEWTLGCAPAVVALGGSIADAAATAGQTLIAMKRPGLIVLDASGAMAGSTPRRVASDRTGDAEMQRLVDQFIIDHHEEVVAAVDVDFAFGAVIGAVQQAVNVSSGRVNFAGCYRAVNLCEPEDPRAARLRTFMQRFEHATR